MAVLAEPTTEVVDDRLAKHNTLVLAVAQALAGGNAGVIVTTGGIVGAILAPDPALATLPISVMVVGMWAGTLPPASPHAWRCCEDVFTPPRINRTALPLPIPRARISAPRRCPGFWQAAFLPA